MVKGIDETNVNEAIKKEGSWSYELDTFIPIKD